MSTNTNFATLRKPKPIEPLEIPIVPKPEHRIPYSELLKNKLVNAQNQIFVKLNRKPEQNQNAGLETKPIITKPRANIDFNKRLRQKNNVLQEYLTAQTILSNMSPEKRQNYSQIVNTLYSPLLKPYIKQETVSDVMGQYIPESIKQFGSTPWDQFTKFYPILESQKRVRDYYPDGKVPEMWKGLEDLPLSQAIRMSDKISNEEKVRYERIIKLLELKNKIEQGD